MTATKVQNMHIPNCVNESAQFSKGDMNSIVQQPVAKLHEDQFRVTSIPYTSTKVVIFSGTPLKKNSYRANSGKYYVTIKINPDALPTQPAIGQYWSVKGNRQIEDMNIGDYVMQQHTYESPEHVECRLPETGEQLIRFIAKESAFKGIGESKARALWELLGKSFHATHKDCV